MQHNNNHESNMFMTWLDAEPARLSLAWLGPARNELAWLDLLTKRAKKRAQLASSVARASLLG
jgi:hypothetical protein